MPNLDEPSMDELVKFAYKILMAKKAKKAESQPEDLEAALKALEKTVEKLEEPEIPLEDSIELFETGTKLAEVCYSRLKEAEKKVEVLMKKVPNPSSADDFKKEEFATDDY
jgi:exodeoxyribonuclease VII small subunit